MVKNLQHPLQQANTKASLDLPAQNKKEPMVKKSSLCCRC